MQRLLGPMNPTTNDECGLLVEGFDSPPVFMMTYNPRYYVRWSRRKASQSQGPAGIPHRPGEDPHGPAGPHCRQDQTAQSRLAFRPVRRKTLAQTSPR